MTLFVLAAVVLLTPEITPSSPPRDTIAAVARPEAVIRLKGDADDDAACAERITEVRAERGLPMLQREPASPDRPLLIAAVDHRIDDCGVLVMRADTDDIRPSPTLPNELPGLMPAR